MCSCLLLSFTSQDFFCSLSKDLIKYQVRGTITQQSTTIAYASVNSLMGTVELVVTSNLPVQSRICDYKEEFTALHEKVISVEVFLRNIKKTNDSREMTDFEVQIKEVANVVEHTIQLRVAEVVMENDEMFIERADERLTDSLKQVAEDIDHVQIELPKIQDKGNRASNKSLVQDSSSSMKDILNIKNIMVGRDYEKKWLL